MREVLEHHDTAAEVSPVERWHPVEEHWEDASVPLPQTGEQIAAEQERRDRQEAADTRSSAMPSGRCAWTCRPTGMRSISPSGSRARGSPAGPALEVPADRDRDGRRRPRPGRADTAEAPAGASVKAEPSAAMGWELTGQNPFATFGGFGPGPT